MVIVLQLTTVPVAAQQHERNVNLRSIL